MGESMEEPAKPKMHRLIGAVPMKLDPSVFNLRRKTFSWRAFPRDSRHTVTIPKRGVDLH
jgi:hypothetical protein